MSTTRTLVLAVVLGLVLLAAVILTVGGSTWDNLGTDAARLLTQ